MDVCVHGDTYILYRWGAIVSILLIPGALDHPRTRR